MKNAIEFIANKPWILILFGFFLLISVWIFFFTVAVKNQPVRLLEHNASVASGLAG